MRLKCSLFFAFLILRHNMATSGISMKTQYCAIYYDLLDDTRIALSDSKCRKIGSYGHHAQRFLVFVTLILVSFLHAPV